MYPSLICYVLGYSVLMCPVNGWFYKFVLIVCVFSGARIFSSFIVCLHEIFVLFTWFIKLLWVLYLMLHEFF